MSFQPRSWRSSFLVLALAAGCGADNSALLDSGFDPLQGDATIDTSRPPPIPMGCAADGGFLPDGGCPTDGGTLPDGALADGAMPPPVDTGPPPPPPPPCNQVTFEYRDPLARTVWVSGTFTRWAATPTAGAIELTRAAGSDTWRVQHLVEPRGRHEYKFVVDGTRWVRDPMNPDTAPDGVGGQNSVLNVCGGAAAMCGDLARFDWRDAVMYFAMVDRFVDSDGRADPVPGASGGDARAGASGQYAGGDLPGVTARMPYLANLGVSALWLSAPYENRNTAGAAIDPRADPHQYSAFHGYWPSPDNVSYGDPRRPSPAPRVESRIGTAADLRALVTAAHGATTPGGHGIKVLFDYVMKHVDTESGLYRAHNNWFARHEGRFRLCGPENLWNDPVWGTRCAFTDYLAPFDFDNAEARAWSVNDAVWWAREFGIDGYRLDAIKHVPTAWLTDLRTRLSSEFASPAGGRFYLVGETFDYDNRDVLRSFVNPRTMLDGQFDFPFKARLCEALFTPGGRLDGFASWMADNDRFYGAGAIMSTFIGNHDIPRAIHFASRQIGNCREGSNPGNGWAGASFPQPTDAAPYERLGVAFAVMLTNPGVPLIYYGDEVGLAGGGDPDNRRMMPRSDAELNAHQRALRDRVGALGRIRAENPVLGRGNRVTLAADQDTWVYQMTGCEGARAVTVAINRADAARPVTIPAGTYTNLQTRAEASGGAVTLEPRSFLVLRAR